MGQADYLRTGFEILEGRAFDHNQTLVCSLPCLKQSSFDTALQTKIMPPVPNHSTTDKQDRWSRGQFEGSHKLDPLGMAAYWRNP